jgi:pyruvate ferredoxin oxidoreductase alpha subunit
MTIGNRAIGAPINIWNDHSDAMALRDSGWIQLFAETNQEAADLHIQAFRLAEELSCPVMVCMDGFILTHAVERVDVPAQDEVDALLPRFEPAQLLDPADPITIGAMVGPDAFAEVRYLDHMKHLRALEAIPRIAGEFERTFGRTSGGLVRPYRTDGAETIVVALGSVNGTIKDVVDELRDEGASVGAVNVCSFRPFPTEALAEALMGARRVVVLEKNLVPGLGGALAENVQRSVRPNRLPVHTVIAGLGGRAITRRGIRSVLELSMTDRLDDLHFLDLNHEAVSRELAGSEA